MHGLLIISKFFGFDNIKMMFHCSKMYSPSFKGTTFLTFQKVLLFFLLQKKTT